MLKNIYVDCAGRMSRKMYWVFGVFGLFIFTILATVFLYFATAAMGLGRELSFYISLSIIFIATLWPFLSVTIKRLHDIDLTGWFSLIALVPYINLLFVLLVGLVPGNKATNKYGPNPKQSSSEK